MSQRTPWGGCPVLEKGGERKPHERHPSQKRCFGPPPPLRLVRFQPPPPLEGHWSVCPVYLMALYRAMLRYYRCDTHIARCFFREVSRPPQWCEIPPHHFALHRHICAMSHFAAYRAIIVRYGHIPHNNKCQRLLRYYRYKYRAI